MISYLVDQASSYAADIDELILVITVLVGFWFLLAEFLFFYLIVKFRRSKNKKAKYISGEKHSEKKWIHWAHNAVIVCDIIIIVVAVQVWYNIKQDLPKADHVVRIVGYQWAWKFVHPGPDGEIDTADDIATVDELHVKVGSTYHFKLESEDVLHSFSVPVFRLKQDAVPGRIITGWFKPTKIGNYDIQCAEMCGIGHGVMSARIFIESEAAHLEWMTKQTAVSSNHSPNKNKNQNLANMPSLESAPKKVTPSVESQKAAVDSEVKPDHESHHHEHHHHKHQDVESVSQLSNERVKKL